MPHVLDTNVVLRHGMEPRPGRYLLPAVVLQELTAGAADGGIVRYYHRLRRDAEQEDRLLVPDGEDWWYAGKVLNALFRGLRSHRQGHTAAIAKEEQRRLVRDVLIARTARRVNAVVTYDGGDFRKIRRFCAVRGAGAGGAVLILPQRGAWRKLTSSTSGEPSASTRSQAE